MDEPLVSFNAPTHLPYAAVTRHLWGDALAGEVSDWTFFSSSKLTQLLFELPPQGAFRHSKNFKTIFAADELYFVISGVLALANPATGEIVRASRGEAIFFQRDTWHHGFNDSTEPLRVLEYFAPPPAQGTGAAYARRQPNLDAVRYARDELLARWMPPYTHNRHKPTLQWIRPSDYLMRLEGDGTNGITSLLVSTAQLTVGILELLPGQHTLWHAHGGDEGIYVLQGQLHIRISERISPSVFELNRGDGFYLPENIPHEYHNPTDSPARLLFGIAPHYFPLAR